MTRSLIKLTGICGDTSAFLHSIKRQTRKRAQDTGWRRLRRRVRVNFTLEI